MSWEDEDLDAFTLNKPATTTALVGRWDDEDVDVKGDAKDSWEDEDEVPEEKPKVDTQKNFAKTSAKKQSGRKEQKKLEQKVAEIEASQPVKPLSYEEKKKLQDKVERADFIHAVDMFEGVQDPDNESLFGPASSSKPDNIDFKPTTPADFKKFGSMLAEQLTPYKESFSYLDCLKQFLRDTTANSDPEEIKELIASLNVLVNERIKANQPAKKKKAIAKRQAAAKKEVLHMDDEYSAF